MLRLAVPVPAALLLVSATLFTQSGKSTGEWAGAKSVDVSAQPMVLTFDKMPDDGSCEAANRIADGIHISDEGSKVRLVIDPWIVAGDRSDHMKMRMVLAGCAWLAEEKGNRETALAFTASGFILAAMDDYLHSQAWAKAYNEVLAAYQADEKYIVATKQSKKAAIWHGLRNGLAGAAAGYLDYQRALASRQPIYCTGQQMGWLFSWSCQ